ncbi:MAG: dUTP diphosphatase [Myxococcales bacterium]|nr:dUTP diphosphatase [Myxococcales bacterium]
MTTVQIQRLHPERDADLPLPRYMTPGAAGADVVAANESPIVLGPLARVAVPTGLALAIPAGWEAQVRPRSGNALKKGLTVVNSPGTIDSDYRGEVGVLLVNLSDKPVQITRGDRICQLVFAQAPQVTLTEVVTLDDTKRGAGGFGSTGLSQ